MNTRTALSSLAAPPCVAKRSSNVRCVASVAKPQRAENVQAAVSSAAANLGKMAVAVGSSLLLAGVRCASLDKFWLPPVDLGARLQCSLALAIEYLQNATLCPI